MKLRPRMMVWLVAGALLIAACGGGGAAEPAPAAADPGAGSSARLLSYDYRSGQDMIYRFEMAVDMVMEMDGPPGSGGDVVMGMDMSGETRFVVAPGPDAGTTEIMLIQTLDDVSLRSFTVDGAAMDAGMSQQDLAELARSQGSLPEVSVIVDEQGNILSMAYDGAEVPLDLLGGGSLGGLDPTGGATGLESFLGPAFPTDEVVVGDEWDVTTNQEIPYVGTVGFNEHHRISGEQTIDGHPVIIIDTTMAMDRIHLDFSDMLGAISDADPALNESLGLTQADIDLMMSTLTEDFAMEMDMEITDATSRSWFDPVDGVTLRTDVDMNLFMGVDMAAMGENIRMDMTMSTVMRLDLVGYENTA